MISGVFCSVFWGTVSLLLSGTTYVEIDTDFEKYWEAPCYPTPNNHPILGYLPPSPSLFQCKEYGGKVKQSNKPPYKSAEKQWNFYVVFDIQFTDLDPIFTVFKENPVSQDLNPDPVHSPIEISSANNSYDEIDRVQN